MSNTENILDIYNEEILKGAASVAEPLRLPNPTHTAKATSPICGSTVVVELSTGDGNKITAFGYDAQACALGKYVVSIVKDAITGRTLDEVLDAGKKFERMLDGEKIEPEGAWSALQNLKPMIHYTSRHNAMLLPFEAIEKAFKNKS